MKKHRIALDVKEQIINRIKNDGISVVQAAADHGVKENTIYGWIAKKTEGQPTISEIIKLKRERDIPRKLSGHESSASRSALCTITPSSPTKTGSSSARSKKYSESTRHTAPVVSLSISR